MRVHGNEARWLCHLALGMTLTAALAACGGSAPAGGSGNSSSTAAASAPAPSAATGGSGAGAASGGGSAAGTPDPCKVVTAGDASQLTGQTLTKSGKSKAAATRICNYSGAGVTVIVAVARFPSVSQAQAQSSYNEAVRKFSAYPGVTLTHPGIGDKSLAGTFSAGGFTDTAIAVVKGNVYLSIQATTHVKMASLKALAVTALGRV